MIIWNTLRINKASEGRVQKNLIRKFKFWKRKFFKGIENKIYIFRNNGFYTKDDFAEVNKKDVLKLEGIGEKTILRLIQNGVEFKKIIKKK